MGKYRIDDILSELGLEDDGSVSGVKAGASQAAPAKKPEPAKTVPAKSDASASTSAGKSAAVGNSDAAKAAAPKPEAVVSQTKAPEAVKAAPEAAAPVQPAAPATSAAPAAAAVSISPSASAVAPAAATTSTQVPPTAAATPAAAAAPAKPKPREDAPAKKKKEDGNSFSPLPSMPANQRRYGTEPEASEEEAGTSAENPKPGTPAVGDSLTPVYTPDEADSANAAPKTALGELLLAANAVTVDKLAVAEQIVKNTPGKRLSDALLDQGVDEAAVRKAEAELQGVPFERIAYDRGLDAVEGVLLQRLGTDFCRQNNCVPLRREGNRAFVGVTRTDDFALSDELKQRLGMSVKLVMVTAFDIRGALDIIDAGSAEANNEETFDPSQLADESEADVVVEKKSENEINLEEAAAESPVIKLANHVIQTAVKEGASDIHIEPSEKKLRVRLRIDGELFETMNLSAAHSAALTSRLKIMANLDISEKRKPQDGRIRCQIAGRKLDLRMSTIPTPSGEKTVMRILDTKSINVELDKLGFAEETLTIWKKLINLPHGIVLVTGPTGSGKTTTLYSSLRQLDKNTMNISTVEDPVEYHLDGITQTQMHEKIGMTFAVALKALLRQDPDVIMVGEIRDQETALTAVQAALTGHLVLSTLHTNDAPGSITRLINIGLEPFLIGAAVNGVLAQRLIRRLCVGCKAQEPPSEDVGEFLATQGFEPEFVWKAKGCERCRKTGYSGRVGIYELLSVDDQLRDVIARNPNVAEFRRLCIERGMVTLQQDGMKKVMAGITTIEEVMSATRSGH